MRTYKLAVTSLLILPLFMGCSNEQKKFFEDERYEKMVYIVSDNNNIHDLVYDLDGNDNNIRNLSIACSGTNPTTEVATMTIVDDNVLLDKYNYSNFIEDYSRYALKLDMKDYVIENTSVVYPVGAPYTLVPIKIELSVIESLDPDKIYFIPLAIENAAPYPVVDKKYNAMMRIQKKNKYSSTANPTSYNVTGYEGNGYFSLTKTLVPLTKNQVRINLGTKQLPAEPEQQPDFIKKNTVIIEIADDNSLTVKPYNSEEMQVETLDCKALHPEDNAYALYNNRFDLQTTSFYVYYRYKLKTGNWTEVREAIRLPIINLE